MQLLTGFTARLPLQRGFAVLPGLDWWIWGHGKCFPAVSAGTGMVRELVTTETELSMQV